ncbi:Ribonuclease VapC9 [uncultured archaeon]|nr:Ribonuclease VapC9 [uncultured archaeon]
MTYAILDTNFILSCIRKKIDFFNDIKMMGLKIIIPIQVLDEVRRLSMTAKGKFKDEARLALSLMEKNEFKRVDLYMKNVDNGIVKIAEDNRSYIVATLDREIKNKIKNRKLVIRGEKELEIV